MRRFPLRTSAAVLGAAALAVGPLALPAQSADDVTIQIMSINDFHGRLEQSGSVGGAAVLAGAVNQFRGENPNTIFAGAGDFIGASTFVSFIQDDNPTIDAMNASDLEVSSVGNHEFDQGYDDLINDVIGGDDGHAAAWPYLGANVYFKGTSNPALQEYDVIDVGGISVGFVGVVTAQTASLVNPDGIANLDFGRPVDAINRVAAQLSDGDESNGEADVVIALCHEGAPEATAESAMGDNAFGDIVRNASPEVEAIISGHTHLMYDFELPVPGEPGKTRPVISSGAYSTYVGQTTLTIDPETGEVASSTVANHALMTYDAGTGTYQPNYPADPKVQKIVDDAVAAAQELGDQPLGKVTANITRAFDVVDGALSEDRGEESTLGNLVADAQLEAGADRAGAVIAFMNPGGLRADLCYAEAEYEQGLPVCSGVPDDGGVITYRDAANVQPFANTLVTLDLTGAQIRTVLEEQSQPAGSSRPYLSLGVSKGFTYTYTLGDPDPDTGVIPLEINGMWLNGTAIDPAASYTVVVNSFLAAGGDNFFELANGANSADSGLIDLQSFVTYMGAHTPVSPDLQERAIDLSTQGTTRIEWPPKLGNPPAMEAGKDAKFSLVTDMPIALPEQFSFTVDAPEGIDVEFEATATTAPDVAHETLIKGLPDGAFELPFNVALDSKLAAGDYEITFTLDRTGDSSIFDGNPLATPATLTVSLSVSKAGTNPGGGIGTGVTGGAHPDWWSTLAVVMAILGGVFLLLLTGTLAIRMRKVLGH